MSLENKGILNRSELLESPGILKTIKFFAATAFFATVFLIFLKVDLWDYDFWWHIATGRYIVETGTIPDKDPFSYTSNLDENRNPFPGWENSVLKQYWLSQIILYLIYDYAGPKGIIILRSVLLILTLFLVFRQLQRWSVSLPVTFIFVFMLFTILMKALGERPVLFTILFTALAFFILEDFKDKKDKRILLLPPLMLLWSNLHGGFILGVVIIMSFIIGEGIKILLKKDEYTRHEIILFYTVTIMSIGLSFINPTGWDAFSFALSTKYRPFTEGVYEYQSPFLMYKNKLMQVQYSYVFLVLIFPIVLILRNRKFDLSHFMLLSGTLIMSISAMRFIVYYGIIGAMVLGKESDILIRNLLKMKFSDKAYQKILNGLTIAIFFSAILFMTGFLKFKDLNFDIARYYSVPAAAVDFIEKNSLQGNMFNDMNYGGYIAWRLYPWQKTFIDTRAPNFAVRLESGWIEGGVDSVDGTNSDKNVAVWKVLLNHYKVNFVFMPLLNLYGYIPPLIFKLSESEMWVPVYCDMSSIIFIRNTPENSEVINKFRLSKDDVYNRIIYMSTMNALLVDKINPGYFISLGETFYRMGRLHDALIAYRYALKRLPNPVIQKKINQIESEMNDNK
jgi:hypothetical protein